MSVDSKLLSAVRKVAVWAVSFLSIALVYHLVLSAIEDSPDGITNSWRATALFLGLVVAIIIHSSLRLLLEPRQRIIGTMALRNLRRRKRNTALIVIGLLVGSAIISSSLVVGDSLDATLNAEFTEALDETDIVIQGTDINGFPVWWNQSSALDFVRPGIR